LPSEKKTWEEYCKTSKVSPDEQAIHDANMSAVELQVQTLDTAKILAGLDSVEKDGKVSKQELCAFLEQRLQIKFPTDSVNPPAEGQAQESNEAAAKKEAEEEAAKKPPEDEAAAKKQAEEEAAKKQSEDEAAA